MLTSFAAKRGTFIYLYFAKYICISFLISLSLFINYAKWRLYHIRNATTRFY